MRVLFVVPALRQLRKAGKTGRGLGARCEHGRIRQARQALQTGRAGQVTARAREPRETRAAHGLRHDSKTRGAHDARNASEAHWRERHGWSCFNTR